MATWSGVGRIVGRKGPAVVCRRLRRVAGPPSYAISASEPLLPDYRFRFAIVLKGSFFSILQIFGVLPLNPVLTVRLQVPISEDLTSERPHGGRSPDAASLSRQPRSSGDARVAPKRFRALRYDISIDLVEFAGWPGEQTRSVRADREILAAAALR